MMMMMILRAMFEVLSSCQEPWIDLESLVKPEVLNSKKRQKQTHGECQLQLATEKVTKLDFQQLRPPVTLC